MNQPHLYGLFHFSKWLRGEDPVDVQFGKISGKTKLFRSVLNDDLIMKSLTYGYVEKILPIEALMVGACKFRMTKTSAHFQSEFRIHQLVRRTHFIVLMFRAA